MTSKKEWLTQIIKENPGKDLDQFNHSIDGHITGLAFAHQEDIENLDLPLLLENTSNDWNIGIQFIIEEHPSSVPIYYALEHGAEHLEFFFKSSSQLLPFLDLIKDVHFQMIHSSWNFEHVELSEWDELMTQFELRYPSLEHVYFPMSRDQDYYNQILDLKTHNVSFRKFTKAYTFPPFSIFEWKKVLYDISQDFILHPPNSEEIMLINMIIGNDFLTTVASIRALKKYVQVHYKKVNFKIQTQLDSHLWTSEHHTNLMISSLSTLASSMVGPSTIWCAGKPFNTQIADHSKIRNVLHVQQILKNESFMNRVIDPAAGSYYIEDLSHKIFLELYEFS